MKQKWISGLLAICLLITLLPLSVDAAEGGAAKVGTTIYDTLEEAISAASGTPVELLQDAAVTTSLQLPSGLVLEGGGHRIYAAGTVRTEPLISIRGAVTLRNCTLDSNLRASGVQAGAGAALTLDRVQLLNSRGSGLMLRGASLTASGLVVRGSARYTAIDLAPEGSQRVTVTLLGAENDLDEPFPLAADNWTDNKKLVTVTSEDPRYQYEYTVPPMPKQVSFLLPELLAGTQYEKYLSLILLTVNNLQNFPPVTVNQVRIDRHVWSQAAEVRFTIEGGHWAEGGSQPITVKAPLLQGRGTLPSPQVPTGMTDDKADTMGLWSTAPNTAPLGIAAETTYTYQFVPGPGTGPAAKIGSTEYDTLETALQAAAVGDTVLLLRDTAISAVIRVPAGVLLDGQGHRLFLQDGLKWSANKQDNSIFQVVLNQQSGLQHLTLDSMRQAAGVLAADCQGVTLTDVTILRSKGVGLTVRSAQVQAENLRIAESGLYASIDVTPGTAGISSLTLTNSADGLQDLLPIVASQWTQNQTRVQVDAAAYPLQQYLPHMQVKMQMPKELKIPLLPIPKELTMDPGDKNLWFEPVEVQFLAEGGTFADSTRSKTVQLPRMCGAATLALEHLPAPAADLDGAWDVLPNLSINGITAPVTYIYRYDLPPVSGDYEITWQENGALVRPGAALKKQPVTCVAAVYTAEGRLVDSLVQHLEGDPAPVTAPGCSIPVGGSLRLYFLDKTHHPLAAPAIH